MFGGGIVFSLLSPITVKANAVNTDVYYIYTADDLVNVAKEVNSGKTFENETIYLSSDIDLNGIRWIPIGNADHPFKGSIKAVGAEKRVISNLTVSSSKYGGLIGCMVVSATSDISNIELENVSVSATNAGGLAGYVKCNGRLNVENCSVSGSVKGTGCTGTGGIIGILQTVEASETNLTKCKNSAAVYSFGDGSCSGGLVGTCFGNSSGSVNMEMCCNSGKITAEATYSYCTTAAGGLIGDLRTDIIKIEQCFNESIIYAKAYYEYVGGLIGTLNRDLTTDFQIIDSYVNATVKGVCTNGTSQAGGLIGHTTGDNFTRAEIIRCYATGGLDARNRAGLSCWHDKCSRETTIRDCRYNREEFRLDEGQFSCNLGWFSCDWYTSQLFDSYSLTNEQMTKKENYSTWDFDRTWAISETRNGGNPYLRWYYNEIPIDYSEYELHIYSQVASGSIGVGQTVNFAPVLSNDMQRLDTGEGDFTVEIQDQDIVSLSGTEVNGKLLLFKLLGMKEGTTTVTFTHVSSQKSQTLQIAVLGKREIYDISNLFKDTVVYNNHLFVDNFNSIKKTDGSYTVSFDVYNEAAFYGAVEVYNADGKIIEVEKIDRFEAYPSSLKEVLIDSLGKLISDFVTWDIGSYKAQVVTKHTPIEVEVPDGGYILISNDVRESVSCYLYNELDILFWAYSQVEDAAKDLKDSDLDIVVQKGQESIIENFLNTMTSVESQEEFRKRYQENLISEAGKIKLEQVASFWVNMVSGEELLSSEINIDCKELFVDTALENGFSVVQSAVEKFGGVAGTVLTYLLEVEDCAGRFVQVFQMAAHMDTSSIKIEIEGEDDALVSENVIVENIEGPSITSQSLVVTDKTSQENLSYYVEKLSGTDNQSIRIWDITMYVDNEEVQPEGRIKVKIPLPDGWNQKECRVFREEKDNSFTDMNASYEDGYIVFVTEHLSTYVLLQTKEVNNSSNAGSNTGSGGGGSVTAPGVQQPNEDQATDDINESSGNGSADDSETDNKNVTVKGITVTAPSKKIAAGKKVSLDAEVAPINATNKSVTWTSSNRKYASVNKNGVVTVKKAGAGKYVTITATANDGSGVKQSVRLRIMKDAVKKITIQAPRKTIKAKQSLQLKAIVTTTGEDANKKLRWVSSNKKYATVSATGKVRAKVAGKGKVVKITAYATDGSNKKATVKIRIQ